MDSKNIRAAARFAADKMVKASVFQTERLFYDVYCLEPGQAQKIHSHAGSDKVYLVLSGRAVVAIGDEERELGPDEAVLAPAGVAHGIRNAGSERVTALVVTTPPPQ
jgi:mannose-6-phosphate isomerase-like protein (cupin superfamily)